MAVPTTVVVQMLGGQRKGVQVPPSANVDTLRAAIGEAFGVQADTLRLVHKGSTLPDGNAPLRFTGSDVVLATPTRKPPAPHLVSAALGGPRRRRASDDGSDGDDDDDDEDEPARLPLGAPQWEARVVEALRSSGAPALLMEWVVIVRPMRVAALLGFVVGCLLSSRAGVGPIFILAAIAAAIFSNLGRRRDGEQSAYSIFNTGMRRLPGQLDADQIDEQMRRGQF